MEVYLTPEKEVQLRQLAMRTGRDTAQLVGEAVDRLLEDDTQFRAAVRDGFTAIDRGDFIEEEQMDIRIAQMLQR